MDWLGRWWFTAAEVTSGNNLVMAVGALFAGIVFIGQRTRLRRMMADAQRGNNRALSYADWMLMVIGASMLLNGAVRGYWQMYYVGLAAESSWLMALAREGRNVAVGVNGLIGLLAFLHIRETLESRFKNWWAAAVLAIAAATFLVGASLPRLVPGDGAQPALIQPHEGRPATIVDED